MNWVSTIRRFYPRSLWGASVFEQLRSKTGSTILCLLLGLGSLLRGGETEVEIIRVGLPPDWPPFSFFDVRGVPLGADIELVRLIGARMDAKIEIIYADSWGDLYDAALRGEIDVLSSIAQHPEREPYFLFSDPYYSSPIAMVVRSDDVGRAIHTRRSLEGRVIAMAEGYASTRFVQMNYPEIRPLMVADNREALALLASGEADVAVGNLANLTYFIRMDGFANLRIEALRDARMDLRFAVARSSKELAERWFSALESISAADRAIIFDRWVKINHSALILWERILPTLIAVAISVVTIVAVLIIVNRRLGTSLRKIQETECALRRANQHLQALSEEKSQLINMVGHDLRSPLSCLRMRTETFREIHSKKMAPAVVELLDGIGRDMDVALHLVHRLLESERIGAAEDWDMGPLAVEQVCDDLLNRYAVLGKHKGITFKHEIPAKLPNVRTNREALMRILDNLLGNAFKFTPPGGEVRFEVYLGASGRVRFSVIDDGPGIPPDDMARLFQKFARLTPKPTSGEPSSGLGLFIVKRLTDIIGAEIHCDSKLGSGSKFTLVCPTA